MIDLLIVIAFVIYAVASGFSARVKASRNLEEYFLAGKSLAGWKAGFSMAATQFAADTPLLVTGLIATGGIFLVWRLWIYGIAFLMMAFILSAKWRRAGILTDAELTEIRYSGKGVLFLRVLKAVYYGTVINCAVMAMVLVAAMKIAEVFLPWHLWLQSGMYDTIKGFVEWSSLSLGTSATGLEPLVYNTNSLISIVVIVGFTALYSTTGGLRSVVTTDVMQFSLAMVGTAVYAVVVVNEVGGLGAMVDRLTALYGMARTSQILSYVPKSGEAYLPFLILISLQWFYQMNSDGTGYLAQRSMACRTDRQARIAGVLFTWLQIFLRSLIWLVIGVGLLVIYPFTPAEAAAAGFAVSREITFVTGINDLLPPGIRGIMLTGMLAALASTIDTHLNWGASYWSNDIYKRLICKEWLKRQPRDFEQVLAARLSNILILIIAVAVMANLGSIQKAWQISLLFGAGMGAVLVLRWLWERINLYSEIAAIAVSLVSAPIILMVTDTEWVRLASMASISTVITIIVTLLTPRTEMRVLTEFFKRVNPSGFWKKTATALGVDPKGPVKRLRSGIRAVVFCSHSVFMFLAGLGKLLIYSPEQDLIWPIIYLAVGIGFIPFWWKDLIRK